MIQPIDERVHLPKIVQHILFMIFGISGILLLKEEQHMYTYVDSLVLLISAICAALTSYGAISLFADIRKTKGIKGFMKNLVDKFEITPYDNSNRNSN